MRTLGARDLSRDDGPDAAREAVAELVTEPALAPARRVLEEIAALAAAAVLARHDRALLSFALHEAEGDVEVAVRGHGATEGHGATDEHGIKAEENKMHVHDLHATILHLLGLDHTRLTYNYSGRDFRLTEVHGNVAKEILA